MPLWLIQIVVGLVLQVAATLAQQAFAPKPQASTPAGYRDTVQTGGKVPQSFVIGTFGLPGKLEYESAWGNSGETPNAYLVQVISLGDLPITALTGLYEAGQAMTLSLSGHTTQGYPVAERKDGSTDIFWWEFFDGSQTSVNSYLSGKFGSDPDRPWTSEMIGRGLPYVTLTALVNQTIWQSKPVAMMQVQGIPLYDPRLDTTAGGSGSQRLDDQSTWAFTDNLAVMIYNVLVGIRYENAIIWGGRCAQSQLPYTTWAAAMDACDADNDLVGGGTEKQFRGGREVSLNEKPADIITEFLIAANARISEAAGIYTILVGPPADADFSFSDVDTIVTEAAQLDPFPNLDNTVNGATATYLEPAQAWESKETSPYYRSDLETADRGRQQAQGLTLNAVFSGTQTQRILKATVEEARRFARHVVPLVPVFGTYRPLQTGAWTSGANGYSAKLFLITSWIEATNGNVTFGLQEIDPADHNWSTADESPLSFAPLTAVVPAPQLIASWGVLQGKMQDEAGKPWFPTVDVSFAGLLPDISAVRVQIRESWGNKAVVFDGTVLYDVTIAAPRWLVPAHLLSSTVYEVRGIFVPFAGRVMRWSNQDVDGNEGDWFSITTLNVPALPAGSVQLETLASDITAFMGSTGGMVRRLIEQFERLGTTLDQVDQAHYIEGQSLSRSIGVQLGELKAGFDEVVEVSITAINETLSAHAARLESLYSSLGGNSAQINIRYSTDAAPDGYASRLVQQAAVNADGLFRAATEFLDVPADVTQPTRKGFMAGQVVFFTEDGTPLVSIDEDGVQRSANGVKEINWITGAESTTVVVP